jgi:hypothetical protein
LSVWETAIKGTKNKIAGKKNLHTQAICYYQTTFLKNFESPAQVKPCGLHPNIITK